MRSAMVMVVRVHDEERAHPGTLEDAVAKESMVRTPWMQAIGSWFNEREHTTRLEKVLGYGGCRELWLQAELAMWLERKELLAADGNWDTNLLIANYGRCDLGVGDSKTGFDLVLEVKILGGSYQTKVLTGTAGTLRDTVEALRAHDWRIDASQLPADRSFGVFADVKRLIDFGGTRTKLLLLLVDNRRNGDSLLGEALANLQLPAKEARTYDIGKDVVARIWEL